MMYFAHPWRLLLLVLPPFAFWLALRRSPPAFLVPHIHSLPESDTPFQGLHPRRITALIEVVGIALLIVATAGPWKKRAVAEAKREAADIVFLLDLSGSMGAYDPPPAMTSERDILQAIVRGDVRTRLELAKRELKTFVQGQPGDRFGLIVFARDPYLAVPPTFDHAFLRARLEDLETGSLEEGTDLSAALTAGLKALESSPSAQRVLVLLSDGENTISSGVPPGQVAGLAPLLGITIHAVSLGGPNGVLRVDFLGRPAVRRLPVPGDRSLLPAIADKGKGICLTMGRPADLQQALERIRALAKTELGGPAHARRQDLTVAWGLAGSVVLLIGFFLENTLLQVVP